MRAHLPPEGIHVVTSNVAVPFAGVVLGDIGAQVTHVEPPGGVDCRRMSPTLVNAPAYFHVVKSQQDLADDRPPHLRRMAPFAALVDGADVFLSNLRPRVPRAAGSGRCGPDRQPSETGARHAFGVRVRTGPPGDDAVLQARTGVATVTGEADGPPVPVGVSIPDIGSGIWLAPGVMAVLLSSKRCGRGGAVSTSRFAAGASWTAYHVAAHEVTGTLSRRHGSGKPFFSPYGIYSTGDVELHLGIDRDRFFARLCLVLERNSLLDDPRFVTNSGRVRNDVALRREEDRTWATRTAAWWAKVLADARAASRGPRAARRPSDRPAGCCHG